MSESTSSGYYHAMPTFLALVPMLGLLVPVAPGYAAFSEILPGDYYPTPPGTTSAALYAFDRVQDGPYVQERKTMDGKIDSTVLALRVAHSLQLGDIALADVMILPWATGKVSPPPLTATMDKHSEGLMDLRLWLTAWLINDKANAYYLGVSGMLAAPTGDCDNRQTLNPGENRWKFVRDGGWQKDTTPKFLVELSPAIARYGDNDDHLGNRKLEQRPSYAFTSYLRWCLTPTGTFTLVGRSIAVERHAATRPTRTIPPILTASWSA